ncbi:MAG: UDP-N-acetylmuramoyl-tripeptide--D-alanyl-D-alanine ligase [Sarcina sp.]
MLELNFNEILEAVKGYAVKSPKKYTGLKVSTDTRKIEEGSIFVALKGMNFNGNEYAKTAIENGASVVIVEEVLFDEKEVNENVAIIKVENTQDALANLASFYRNKLDIKVVGITGSTGKTSTKDIMSAVLSSKYKVFKTKGNFNNHIGLPLMILELDSSYDIAILEMGMSDLGEISYLANIARPEIAAITNIGISHIENLKTRENILKAKMEIADYFSKENVLIVNGNDDMLETVNNKPYKVIKTGITKNLDVRAENIEFDSLVSTFDIVDGNIRQKFSLPMPGKHNVSNFMLAYAAAKELSVSIDDMQKGISAIEVTSMRLDLKDANGYKVLDDCYNSSPDSVKSAIDVLMSLSGNEKIAVLGTMRELGAQSENAHKDIGEYAKQKGIKKLFVLGEFAEFIKIGFGSGCELYENKQELIEELKKSIEKDDIILIKASRGLKFEEITNALV